jgi:elongation factor P
MISATDFKTGMTIIYDNEPHEILWFQHSKIARREALVKTKLKKLSSGEVIEKTFRSNEKFELAILNRKKMQYLYEDGNNLILMDNKTYEQRSINKEKFEEKIIYIKEGTDINIILHNNELIAVDIPNFVELKVVDTTPGFKGDTVSSQSKPATVETGAVIMVPMFINKGDVIKIDTRNGEYITRIK